MKKKILCLDDHVIHVFNNDGYKTGGAAVQLYSWIKGWISLGHQVVVVNNFDDKKENENLSFKRSYKPEVGIKGFRWIYYRLPAIQREIRKANADIIYQSGFDWETYFSMRLAKRLGVPFILRISNDIYADGRWEKKQKHPLKRRFAMLALKNAPLIVTQNSYQYDQLKARLPKKHIVKITNPFHTPSASISSPQKSYVAWLGLFQRQKNLPALLSVVEENPNTRFKIAGKMLFQNDLETSELLKKLEKLPNVALVGYLKRHEVIPFLADAYCLLNTSHYEGFSNTFLEAFAAGTPVVTTESVNPDQTISIYELGAVASNHESLGKTLHTYLASQSDFSDISERCCQYVKTHHDPIILSKELFELLNL